MPPPAAFPMQMCPPRNSDGEVVGVMAASGCPGELQGAAQRWTGVSTPGDSAVSILPPQGSLGRQTPAHRGVCQQTCPPRQGPVLPVSRGAFLQLARAPRLDAGAPTPLLLSRPTELFLFPRENKGKPRKSIWRWLSTKGLMPLVPEAGAPGGAGAGAGASLGASAAVRGRVGAKLPAGSGQRQRDF